MNETGNLSINSENFLPIIKKWLYTEKEIFVRELVSNACDAVTKVQKLNMMGQAEIQEGETFQIKVVLNPEEKTLQIIDNGIGMTADEVKQYINQIAFSGATDFLNKYQDQEEEDGEIIGHFGLGFYSAFMVADRVEIDTLSFQKDAQPAKWSCEGGIDYALEDGTRQERGTTITLFLSEEGEEFLEEATLYQALRKYCAFMPVEIYVEVEKANVVEGEEPSEPVEGEEITPEEPKPLNDTKPLWQRDPKDCSDEDYKKFYHQVFHDMNDPLFWIHLNMDYPFRVKGILYFPKLVEHMDIVEGEIKLYANQVYIADNIKEVVPEFLLLLKGVLDCPDMPLNVSRSALQKDGYVEKMNAYITKKVADKLSQLFKKERENYESFWDDIGMFIKYGCLKEEKLYDKIKDALLIKTTNDVFKTIPEYLEDNKEKHENKLFFVTDEIVQSQYIRLFKEQGLEAGILSAPIDKPLISFLEYKNPEVKLQRIDADLTDSLAEKEEEQSEAKKQADEATNAKMEKTFQSVLEGKEGLKIKVQALKVEHVSGMMLLSESSRRMMEMMEVYGKQDGMANMFGQMKKEETLVLNSTNPLVKMLLAQSDEEEAMADTSLLCHQIYDLALMGHRSLTGDEMVKFIDRSNLIMEKLAKFNLK